MPGVCRVLPWKPTGYLSLLPSLGKRLPIVASKRDSMGLDFEVILDD